MNVAPGRLTAYSVSNTPMKMQFKIIATVKVYADESMALFSIEYIDGLANASISNTEDQTLFSFPSSYWKRLT